MQSRIALTKGSAEALIRAVGGLASQLTERWKSLSWNGLYGSKLWQRVHSLELFGRKRTSLHCIQQSQLMLLDKFHLHLQVILEKNKKWNFLMPLLFHCFPYHPFPSNFCHQQSLMIFYCKKLRCTFIYFFINY